MKAEPIQTEVYIANNSNDYNADNDQTELLDTVKEIFSTRKRTTLTDFLKEMRQVLENDQELADYVNNQRDKLGNTALHTCCMMYEHEMNKIDNIFEKTRDIIHNKQDQDDFREQMTTAAVFAAMTKYDLLEAGLDANIRNSPGRTAIELVTSQNRELLLKADQAAIQELRKSATNSNDASSSQHVDRLENETKNESKRGHRCAIL